ncbi:UNVERIFIED_CONTAM: 1-acyl-sn-glycerol-3-phosphate acyltransferase BAT2, chloroplastic [Sesamum radiatum]|uniref:1-acyl-sn-glycerol-3-phosphate acyltransferase BAT2, chloroplastic n=1 Tax=Sesamum radiatum TaxID=300843 RepID=A0AAW2NCB7_SESRA
MHGSDQEGGISFLLPEGTRSKDGKLGPFKKGAFSVAAKTGVPVIPITLIGTGEIMPAGMEGRLSPGSVKVIVHSSLVGNKPDTLCNKARNIIAKELIRQG